VHSRYHERWSLATAGRHGVGNDPRYSNTRCFETFPFPENLTPNLPAASYATNPRAQSIAAAARELVEKRDAWLNPPDLVERVPEVVPGFPDRIVPRNPKAAAILKTRTLTNLYNMRGTPEGTWLDNLHRALDEAVAAAYGWPADLSDDEMLGRLLELNRARVAG
jgi:type II restriction/modification system DNA methylase subunit YeeA